MCGKFGRCYSQSVLDVLASWFQEIAHAQKSLTPDLDVPISPSSVGLFLWIRAGGGQHCFWLRESRFHSSIEPCSELDGGQSASIGGVDPKLLHY